MSLKAWCVAALLVALGGCSEPADDRWPVDFQRVVELNCQARHLKDQRFALADSIRFHEQDSGSGNLSYFSERKAQLSNLSTAIADSIDARMALSMKMLKPAQKALFSDSLERSLKKCHSGAMGRD